MKILCVIDSLGSGGAQRQIVTIAKGMKEKGHDVSFLVYHHEPFYLKDIEAKNIPYHCISEESYLKRLLKLRAFIRKGNYDSILSFLEAANFIVTLSGFPFRKWKLVVGERNANPNILSNKKLRFYRWFHFFTDYVVANSQVNIDLVKKINPFLPSKKFRVIYNTVDTEFWTPTQSYTPFKKNKYNIVVAATHESRKNAKGLIEALHILPKQIVNQLQIDWYGRFDTTYEASEKLVREYQLENTLFFYPETSEIKMKVQEADMVGLFSIYEGLPNVICEAMSIGKPILTSAISDLPIILANTKNILFDPTDIQQIAKALEKVIGLDLETMIEIGKENRNIAKRAFTANKSVEAYLKLLS